MADISYIEKTTIYYINVIIYIVDWLQVNAFKLLYLNSMLIKNIFEN